MLIDREIQQNGVDTNDHFGKLLDEYKRGNDTIIALKDKYQSMQSLLTFEEDQIKTKNR